MHVENTRMVIAPGMHIVQINDKSSHWHQKYYLVNQHAYLHTDGVWRMGCMNQDTHKMTGYFDSPEQIVQALAANKFPRLYIWEHQQDGSGI